MDAAMVYHLAGKIIGKHFPKHLQKIYKTPPSIPQKCCLKLIKNIFHKVSEKFCSGANRRFCGSFSKQFHDIFIVFSNTRHVFKYKTKCLQDVFKILIGFHLFPHYLNITDIPSFISWSSS